MHHLPYSKGRNFVHGPHLAAREAGKVATDWVTSSTLPKLGGGVCHQKEKGSRPSGPPPLDAFGRTFCLQAHHHQASTWTSVLNLTHAPLKSVCNIVPLTILLTNDRINTHVDVAISFYMSAFIIKELCSKNIKMSSNLCSKKYF